MRIGQLFSNFSIRAKLVLAVMVVQIILLVLLISNNVRLLNSATVTNLDDLISQNANILRAMSTAYVDHPNLGFLQEALDELLNDADTGLVYVRFAENDGTVLLSSGYPQMTALPSPDMDVDKTPPDDMARSLLDRPLIHVVRHSLRFPQNKEGFLQFGISNKKLNAARQSILTQSTLIASFEILITFILLSAICYLLTRRLTHLLDASQSLAKGQLDQRVTDNGGDEFDQLARHFNAMASSLQQRIDDLQRSTENLRKSEERYELAIRGANDGLWDWDIVGDRGHFSPRFCEMLGRPIDDSVSDASPLEAPTTLFTARLHPDETALFRARMSEHLKGDTPQFMLEHRIRHEDGSYRWIMTRGVAQRNAQGQAIRMAGSISDIHLRKRIEQQHEYDAMHDGLTGLPNRALFIEYLRHALAQRERDPNFQFAVLALNIERFHLINDSYNYSTGDHLLKQVAEHLSHSLRQGDIVARQGADQFIILLLGLTSAEEAHDMAQQLLNLPDFTTLDSQRSLHIRCRIGLVTGEESNDAETLMRDADSALQSARSTPGANVQKFQASMHDKVLTTLALETELRNALATKTLSVAYQPVVRLFNGTISSLEALARWTLPQKGVIPPNVFIPLAESLGLIHELDMFILERVCLDIRRWRTQSGSPPPVSVNLSVRQLGRPGLSTELFEVITTHELPPELLRFEVTESLLARTGGQTTETLQQLRNAGCAVLIDDFGTGYSALSYLHSLPCDILKLDGSFVSTVTSDPRLRAIVRHCIGLAHDLGMSVIAECIESQNQSQMLRSIGCDFGQGYLFSKPVPAEEISQLIERNRGTPRPAGEKR
ncbi:MAG: EAL domain-containing protein [Azoarcus sp.]|jgi:diguanylate cyclase (GGDEF)-like protein/PAS domain S-box-containing protein|nr:EAL domain-containing protein [Azoarcus sp.]